MPEVAQYHRNSGDQDIGPHRIHTGNGDQQKQAGQPQQRPGTVNQIAFQVFPQKIPLCPEHEELVAQKRIRDGEDVDENGPEQVISRRPQSS